MSLYSPIQDGPENRERKNVAKAVRSMIRLHFSMLGDDYINEVLAPILEEHARCLAVGEEFVLRLDALPSLPMPK